MLIEELGDGKSDGGGGGEIVKIGGGSKSSDGSRLMDAKRAVVGVGARILFYPTLVYNVYRNKMEPEFHWWDKIDEYVLLGAVPFPSDVLRLRELGVCGVVTLNEPYERLVPTSFYTAHGIENLVLPTRDYLYAPSFGNLCKAVDFIHKNASCGKITYVHCKAGRGRSTTVVLCYLVQYKRMTPVEAYEYVRLRRPRILLASSQWQAVKEFYQNRVKKTGVSYSLDNPIMKSPMFLATRNLVAFDESTVVVVSDSDLDGYNTDVAAANVGNSLWAELSIVYRVQFAGQAAIARLSYLWVRCHAHKKEKPVLEKIGGENCSMESEHLGNGHPCLLQGVMVKL